MATRTVLALALAALASSANAQQPGTFKMVGVTGVSAMMMFLGNEENVYIIDKAEGNPVEINGHPAWGAVWNIKAGKAEVIDVVSNTFCASGFHLPNSSWIALGGNGAVSPGPVDYHGPGLDPTYQDVDGREAIRLIAPCGGEASTFAQQCQWVDDPSRLHMMDRRWYSTAEALGTGEILIIGGMKNGGFINRPNATPRDPRDQDGLASNTFEFWPVRPGFTAPVYSDFLIEAGGLNTYAHAFLMPSGKVLMQANISTILFDPDTYDETRLPNMPKDIIRVYPGSAGVAMLPLTPENNYNPTLLFCGGTNALSNYQWGGYGGPNANTWEYRASADCQRLTPEPASGPVAYEQDDDMIQGRTMGQFVLLPDGSMLMMGGAANGTAGYTTQTPTIQRTQDLPFGLSLAAEEILTPAIYYPDRPNGQRWSNAGLAASTIPRMYHSTALVLPDASVFVAGSNPNGDVNTTLEYRLPYPAEYRAEVWYPPYWGKPKPVPTGIPTDALTYGGDYFNLTLANGSYTGAPNVAASKTKVVLLRSGFNTHAMSMGQRLLQLNNTYTVSDNGDITLHVSQLPENPNVFTPGPALMFVVVDGVPSDGKMISVGTGKIEKQPTVVAAALPPVTTSTEKGSDGDDKDDDKDGPKDESSSSPSIGLIIGAAAGGIAAAAALGALIWFICRKKNARKTSGGNAFDSNQTFIGPGVATTGVQQQYGRVDTNATPDSAYPTYSSGAYMNSPGAVTGAPFAMNSAGSRASYHSSAAGSTNELPPPMQNRNYDSFAGARVPSQYSTHTETAYGGMAPSPQDQYYDPYRAYNDGSHGSR